MRPVLFEIPLPALNLPLGLALAVLALALALVAAFAQRRKLHDLLALAGVGAIAALVGAVVLRGQTYRPAAIPIMSYGLLLALSLAAGWALTLRLAERAGLDRDSTAHTYVVSALGGLLGARVLYVITNPQEFHGIGEMVALSSGGLTAYGGFLGGLLAGSLALRRLGLSFMPWADAAAPSVALGIGLTRLGCYLHGCDFGRPLPATAPRLGQVLGTFPRWPEGSAAGSGPPAWVDHVLRRGLSPVATESLPVHPTQLYEAMLGLVLVGLAWLGYARRRFAGEPFLLLALAYAAGRFVVELFRDDVERGHFGPGLPGFVWLLVCLSIVGLALALGPWARRIEVTRSREALLALLFALGTLALLLGRYTAFGKEPAIALSTSQWLALATMVAVLIGGRRVARDAATVPQPALGSSN